MQALSETGAAFSELMVMKEAFRFRPKKTNPLEYTKMKGVEVEVGRKVKELEGPVQIGKMKIEAVPVNHSLPGACGYIVETPSGTVVYTGDLRFHGYGGHLTEAFVKKAAEAEPKLLISEGTRIDSDGGLTEEEVKGEILGHMEGCKKLVLANWPVRDTDRLRTFYEVAKKSGRKLAICTKQAYILKMLYDAKVGTPSPKDKHIAVYMRRKGWGTLGEEGWPENIMLADYADWEKEFLDYENMVTYKDVKESQEEYLLRCDFFELAELIDLKPDKGSVYIRSVVEPFNEEMELDEKRVKNWLAHFGLLPYKQTHCSGHARGPELKRMIEAIAPEMLMPVHTEKPEKFKGLAEKVVIPKKGRKYEI
ncbi:RNase J family beta-CASP ribonuclease [Candidatus Micrarchaeota archaeon]|nr:MAG: RNase J family beta-CASP ribonuclease [Candidatus Micrarchaeota archaeon]